MADPLPNSDLPYPEWSPPEPRQLSLLPPPEPVPDVTATATAGPPAASAPATTQARLARIPWTRVLVGLLAIALAGTAFWGYQTNQALGATRNDLASAKDTISEDTSQISSLQASVSAANSRGDALATQVTGLQAQVATEDSCIAALAKTGKLFADVDDKEVTLNNLTAKGSIWAKADDARDAAMIAAQRDDYNAYSAAWSGDYATANTWVSRANAQISTANKELDIMSAQIAQANELQAEISGMLEEYDGGDLSTCGGPAASGGPSA